MLSKKIRNQSIQNYALQIYYNSGSMTMTKEAVWCNSCVSLSDKLDLTMLKPQSLNCTEATKEWKMFHWVILCGMKFSHEFNFVDCWIFRFHSNKCLRILISDFPIGNKSLVFKLRILSRMTGDAILSVYSTYSSKLLKGVILYATCIWARKNRQSTCFCSDLWQEMVSSVVV